jgi:hypothetical protein
MPRSGFGQRVLDAAERADATVLALKTLARRKWPTDAPCRAAYPKCWYEAVDDPELARLAVRYTLGKRVAAALTPGERSLFRLAVTASADLSPPPPPRR